jgi:hypothetical protein
VNIRYQKAIRPAPPFVEIELEVIVSTEVVRRSRVIVQERLDIARKSDDPLGNLVCVAGYGLQQQRKTAWLFAAARWRGHVEVACQPGISFSAERSKCCSVLVTSADVAIM